MPTLLWSLLFACGHEHDHVHLPDGNSESGEELYTPSCSGCHGAEGTGGYGGPDLLNQTDDHIADYVWNGSGNMPAFPDFSEQDLADIIAHIRVLEEQTEE